jgi:hypothetical protein
MLSYTPQHIERPLATYIQRCSLLLNFVSPGTTFIDRLVHSLAAHEQFCMSVQHTNQIARRLTTIHKYFDGQSHIQACERASDLHMSGYHR